MKKTVLITGASSGFGKITVEKLLATGEWEVYAASRRVEKMADLKTKGAHILKMDVTNDEEVQAGVEKIIKEQGKIDSLLANAGYGSYGTIETIPLEEIKYQYEVNVFGMARTLKAVLPHMRKRKSGRIVLTASVVSHISTAGLGWYASTKHAIKGIGTALRQEVRDLGIDVVMIEPGAVKTGFDRVAFDALHKVNHPADYRELITNFETSMVDSYKKAPGPESTAGYMVKALTVKIPKTVYQTTPDVGMFKMVQGFMSDKAFDNFFLSTLKKAGKKN